MYFRETLAKFLMFDKVIREMRRRENVTSSEIVKSEAAKYPYTMKENIEVGEISNYDF